MTAQYSDQATYQGETYSIAGKNGTGLFDPVEHGMKPEFGRLTSCWHGYVCEYRIDRQRLLLDQLGIFLDAPAPILFGIHPEEGEKFDFIYDDLRHPVPFTGGLLLANDFIEELYVHMGFHPSWKYREVHELIFRDGLLISQTDSSEQIAQLRQEIAHRPVDPGLDTPHSETDRWISQCFNQEYRW